MYFCEADIKQLGVRNSAHRARIVSSLVAFRDKYEHGELNRINKPSPSPLSHLHVFMSNIITIYFCLHISRVDFCFNRSLQRLCVWESGPI